MGRKRDIKAVLDTSVLLSAARGPLIALVTWNTKDFPPKKRFAGITIITPDAFLRLFDLLQ
jgi:hypothetical protein